MYTISFKLNNLTTDIHSLTTDVSFYKVEAKAKAKAKAKAF
ncbi:hypothetical protein BH23THE1_BH23THE1_12640 [soil metagenome]